MKPCCNSSWLIHLIVIIKVHSLMKTCFLTSHKDLIWVPERCLHTFLCSCLSKNNTSKAELNHLQIPHVSLTFHQFWRNSFIIQKINLDVTSVILFPKKSDNSFFFKRRADRCKNRTSYSFHKMPVSTSCSKFTTHLWKITYQHVSCGILR